MREKRIIFWLTAILVSFSLAIALFAFLHRP